MLAKTSKSICILTNRVQGNVVGTLELVMTKELVLHSKAGVFQVREALRKTKSMFALEKQVAQRMKILKKVKEFGIISDYDFRMQFADLLKL